MERNEMNTDNCNTCRHNLPGDCAKRSIGEDGYLHFPPDGCHEPNTDRSYQGLHDGMELSFQWLCCLSASHSYLLRSGPRPIR